MAGKIPFARPDDHSGVWDGVCVDYIHDHGFAEGKPRVGVVNVPATAEQRKKNREAVRMAIQYMVNQNRGVNNIEIEVLWPDEQEKGDAVGKDEKM